MFGSTDGQTYKRRRDHSKMLHLLIIGRHSNINQGTCWTSNLKTQKVHILSKKFEIRSILVQAAISMLQRHSTFHVIFLKNAIWWPEKKIKFWFFFVFFKILLLRNQKKGEKFTSSQPPTNLPPIKTRGTVLPPVIFPMWFWMACISGSFSISKIFIFDASIP